MQKKIFIAFLFSFLLIAGGSVYAQGLCEPCPAGTCGSPGLTCINGKCRGCPTGGTIVFCNPLQVCDIQELIEVLINFMFWLATAIMPLMFIIAGFYWFTAAGNEEHLKTAKNIILWTLVGYSIIFVSWGLISAVRYLLGG